MGGRLEARNWLQANVGEREMPRSRVESAFAFRVEVSEKPLMPGTFAEARIPLPLVCAVIDDLQDCAVCCWQYFDRYIVQIAAWHCVFETLGCV